MPQVVVVAVASLFLSKPAIKMSGYDFSSGLSGYGSSTPSPSGGSGAAQKQQVMDQVRNQVAVAQAQELLQV